MPQYIHPQKIDRVNLLKAGEFAMPDINYENYGRLEIPQNTVGNMRTNMLNHGVTDAEFWVPANPSTQDLEELQNETIELIKELLENESDPSDQELTDVFHRIQLWGGNAGRNIYLQGGGFHNNFCINAYRNIFESSIRIHTLEDVYHFLYVIRKSIGNISNFGLSFGSKHVSFISLAAHELDARKFHLPIFDSILSGGCFGMAVPRWEDYKTFIITLNDIADGHLNNSSVKTIERNLFNFFGSPTGDRWINARSNGFGITLRNQPQQPNHPIGVVPPRRGNPPEINLNFPEREEGAQTLLLNVNPQFYIGIRNANNPGPNIGYISKSVQGRGGEICVYQSLADLFNEVGAPVVYSEGNMQHGGPKRQHFGNIRMPVPNNNPDGAVKFLSQWFKLQWL